MPAVLTQKPPFSTGNLRLLTSAATLEAALQKEPQASHSENGNQPKQRTRGSRIPATGSVCGERPMHSSLGQAASFPATFRIGPCANSVNRMPRPRLKTFAIHPVIGLRL
jgi:hypothetical protein